MQRYHGECVRAQSDGETASVEAGIFGPVTVLPLTLVVSIASWKSKSHPVLMTASGPNKSSFEVIAATVAGACGCASERRAASDC